MTNCVSYGDGAALGNSEERKTIYAGGLDHRLKVLHPRFEREIGDLPIRKPVAAFVVTNKGVIARELYQHMAPDRTTPVEFEMTEPVRRLHQRRPATDGGVGDAHRVSSRAKMDLLFHPFRR